MFCPLALLLIALVFLKKWPDDYRSVVIIPYPLRGEVLPLKQAESGPEK